MTSLDVLVVEGRRGAAAVQADELARAGHRVHRCQGESDESFPCRGITESCPIDGGIDVGLVVRPRVAPKPTEREHGAECLIRADVPLIEDGPEALDPYQPYLAGRVDGDVVEAVERAVEERRATLAAAIRERIAPACAAHDVDPDTVTITVTRDGLDLRVALEGPPASQPVRSALGVRVLDAIRELGHDSADVSYQAVE